MLARPFAITGGPETLTIYRILLAVLLLAMVTACTQTASSPTAEEATPTPTEEPTEEATEDGAEPTLEEGAGDLASVLPDEVGGLTMEYTSASGEEALGSEGMTPEARAFLDRVGADASAIDTAFGFGFDAEGGSGISIVALRVEGANEDQLRTEFRAVMEEEGSEFLEESSLAGKTVLAFGEGESEPTGFMYVRNDTVFIVGGSPPELVEEAIAELP